MQFDRRFVVPKKPLRVPASRTGRGVRWTLEVSSNSGATKTSQARKRAPSARKPRTARKSAATAVKRFATTVNDARKHARESSAPGPARSVASPTVQRDMWNNPRVMVVAAAAVLIVGAAALTRDPARKPAVTLSAAETTASAPEREFIAVEPARAPAVPAPKPAKTRDPHLVSVAPMAPVNGASPTATPTAPPSREEPVVTPVSHEPVRDSLVASNQESVGGPVTITGCLEVSTDGDQFRLTDTDGAGAPKSRGWRSGFIMKRPTPVSLVSSDAASLRKLVGHRVAATGLLDSREMRVRSFHSTGACD